MLVAMSLTETEEGGGEGMEPRLRKLQMENTGAEEKAQEQTMALFGGLLHLTCHGSLSLTH